jgi:hypothetical protein
MKQTSSCIDSDKDQTIKELQAMIKSQTSEMETMKADAEK